ncbi:hypothetical protein [Helicobacter canadensis]|uniref:Uncharacterized protein n=1 Tax=Helicobacter canadensis MIT 98-5491 TaxID=537970 RepID=C5ZYM1_9HELI|nr:hypothetical protein [Helicobacter canadensis]EES90239.1 hypothetical protein HCAN_1534 [Helicobacter canadensis MIT 98-5491]EFR49003.1 prepilin-type cleavage/methylation N-terminal domain protein [Helicobacter canadensis MIT 98-5491]STO99964.1 Uncharacterised protein [Helicobacter canadensis]
MSKRAFSLLEIILFISVVSILIIALLQSTSLKNIQTQSQALELQKVTFCNNTNTLCLFQSNIPESLYFYEVNATK